MNRKLLDTINHLTAEFYLGLSDDEIAAFTKEDGFPETGEIDCAREMVNDLVKVSRQQRLAQARECQSNLLRQWKNTNTASQNKSIDSMIQDIVQIMTTAPARVPEGLMLAFREQQSEQSDEDIRSLWESLAELGLMGSDNEDNSP